MAVEVLSQRALNRALLARQGLLERSDASATEMIERLVGMQAQEPENPYVALFDRLRDFHPEQLSELIYRRRARAPSCARSSRRAGPTHRFTSLTGDPATTVGEIEAEAERLLAFALPDASRRSVRFVPDV